MARTFNSFFETAVDSLGIKENVSDLDICINSEDPVDIAIMKYREHPSIIKITESVSFESRFRFKIVNDNDIQREVLKLNLKKPGTFGNIPTK